MSEAKEPFDPPGRVALSINDAEGRKLTLVYDLELDSGVLRMGDEEFALMAFETTLLADFLNTPAALARRSMK